MNKQHSIINDILVELFNDILNIEEISVNSIGYGDLSITEIHTIDAVGIEEPKTMTTIANKLKITVGTLSISINRLVKKGYALRKRFEEDKRVVLVSLTEKGREVFNDHKLFHNKMIEKLTSDLKIHEDKILIKSLENLREFFKDYLPQS
ncbi:transcriptional regulator [Clostridiaceae bacterium M8S5]|nr:transcriptional regulator [Clostridiaceae bacterium M8S5]